MLADLKPSGRCRMSELVAIGGIQLLMKMLLDGGLLHGQCPPVTGRTLAEHLAGTGTYPGDPDIVLPLSRPLKAESHQVAFRGNVAPEGAVVRITGQEGETFTGRARLFEGEEGATEAILAGRVRAGDVVVIDKEAAQEGPGMRQMRCPTGAIIGRGLEDKVALITDGRFSGGSHGFGVGPIPLLRNGDRVAIDALMRQIKVDPPASKLRHRRAAWKPRRPALRGVLAKYTRLHEQRLDGSGNGRLRRGAVPVEATMDFSVLPDSVMGIGRERQAVVSGQGSGYSSGPHLAMHMACASGSEPSGRRETVSVWGFEPYARQPRRLAARVLNVMNCRTANTAGQLGSGLDRLRASGKTATLHSFRFDPVFSDRSQRRFSNHI